MNSDARAKRAEANRLTIDHRVGSNPGELACKTCKEPWPCTGWEKAQELLRKALRLETNQ